MGIFVQPSKGNAFNHSHSSADKILKENLVVSGPASKVKYANLKKDMGALNAYLSELQAVSRKEFNNFSQDEQLAFLINAYNFYTLKLVALNYPVKSIKDLKALITSPWDREFKWMLLFNKKVTLNQIEHNMIRGKKMKPFKGNYEEPLVHFVLTCASIGCPKLGEKAYRAKTLKKDLEAAARVFLSDPERNYFDKQKNRIYLSKIFSWYGDDFSSVGGVKEFVSTRITDDPKIQKIIQKNKRVYIRYLTYDWALNDAK